MGEPEFDQKIDHVGDTADGMTSDATVQCSDTQLVTISLKSSVPNATGI